jgi:mannosylglycoprotein endo-beta-mannosidase
MVYKQYLLALCSLLLVFCARGQKQYELNTGWQCIPVSKVKDKGENISRGSFSLTGWMPATVPGTVLTTLLNNQKVPDPFYGMNNKQIPDIYFTGREHYTYWFVKDFNERAASNNELIWLHFRGINYGCDIYLNGHKVNPQTHYGMYLRQSYNITPYLSKNGQNRLAVIVYPPNPVGNPNGGQGGDGEIARNVTHQYVAGWDWIQPVRDRNTGIWDKVIIEKTKRINLKNAHIVTLVPGKRYPDGTQQPATIKASAEIENPSNSIVHGILQYQLEGKVIKKDVTLKPNSTTEITLPEHKIQNPEIWWPNGYGDQPIYTTQFQFISGGQTVLDQEDVAFGIREIGTQWNERTRSMETLVNGQKIFIKGGNWIISDAMLRLSRERYDAEIRLHRDMNLNLIRIWGGAITERPEFYQACDRYGLLVFQDFWFSGDCNGKWLDPLKKEDQWTRRRYPEDHQLVLRSVADQVKMIRNHPSLAFWCGGNEITPPEDILTSIKDSILPRLDGTRYFFDYSNSDSMSYNFIGGNGDGPYGIQNINTFWDHRTYPYNSEIGSVGIGDHESLERFIPKENMVVPQFIDGKHILDSVWRYHKYIGYDQYIDPYGKAKDAKDFANKAQLVNYDQYRGLIEGFSAHMWDWYTGVIIWKTQNPWTALRGQMYDYYLDPNACLYGLHNAGEPVHVMYNPVSGMAMVVNNTFHYRRDLMLELKAFDMKGNDSLLTQVFMEIGPTIVKNIVSVKRQLERLSKEDGVFLSMRLLDVNMHIVSENFYWLPDSTGTYSGLQKMQAAQVTIAAKEAEKGKVEVVITNPSNGPVAFFNRISLVDAKSRKRVLPVFYSNNYISILPGEQKSITINYTPGENAGKPVVSVSGWNVQEQFIEINKSK